MPDDGPVVDGASLGPRHVGGIKRAPSAALPWWVVRWPLLIFAVAFVFRYAYGVHRGEVSLAALPDQVEYAESAYRWLRGFGSSFIDPTFWQGVYAFRMPGYPVFVAYGGVPMQAALDAGSALAVLLIGRRLGSEAVGRVAAVLVAFNPYLIYFSSLILSETLFTACLAWATFALLANRRSVQWLGVIISVASIYVRPSAVALGVCAAVVAFMPWHARPTRNSNSEDTGGTPVPPLRGLFRAAVAGTIAAGLTVLALWPWALRNEKLLGERIWLTTNDGFTAYDSFNPAADGSSNQAVFRSDPILPELREIGRSRYLKEKAIDYAVSHPARVVTLAFAKLGRFWSPVPLSADFGGRWLYVLVGGLYCVPLFVFAAIGVWRGGLGRRVTLILLLPALYFSAVHCVFVGSLRYRVPCDVPLAVLAAAGVVSFFKPKSETA